MSEPLLDEPVSVFLTLMAVILVTPLLTERVHLPGIVGLILGGMLVGPHGLNLLATGRTIELFASVGLIYLMFSAGLDIDLNQFTRVRDKAIFLGVTTFIIPQLSGIGLGRLLGLAWPGAVLLGSVYASHTLIAFPILSRLRITRNEAVSVTIGATVFTDVAALLVLAVIAGTQKGEVSLAFLLGLLGLMTGYAALVLLGLPRVGKFFFRHFTAHAVEFQFVLVVLFVAALLAELIGMHAIVGAFLAGLAINSTLPRRSTVVNQVLFLGESFFIPLFLIYIGMILDPLAIVANIETLLTGLALSIAVYATKFLAVWLAKQAFHYSRDEMFTMWGLSQAQAAATLATILVGVEVGVFPSRIFDGAILMILLTSITSPLLVERFGTRLRAEPVPVKHKSMFARILVPVANPATQEHLISLASILAQTNEGTLLPLNVAQDINGQMVGLEQQRELLEADVLQNTGTNMQPIRRIDTSIAQGILRAAIENDASLIVMGWRGRPTLRQSIFGTVLDEVVWNTELPVIVGRLTTPINAMRRIILVVPPRSLNVQLADRTLEVLSAIAQAVNVPVLALTARGYFDNLHEKLSGPKSGHPAKTVLLAGRVVQEVAEVATSHDLILVTTMGSRRRFRSSLGRIPEQIATTISCSIVVIHYQTGAV